MKFLLIALILGAAGYFFYQRSNQPIEITDPVYAEYRVEASIGSRQIEMLLLGKMASDAECKSRSDVTWKKMIDGCPQCAMGSLQCTTTLEPRYLRLFNNETINSTYISLTHGDNTERDGRMVMYGLTVDEGKAVCEQVKTQFKTKYAGEIVCVPGKLE